MLAVPAAGPAPSIPRHAPNAGSPGVRSSWPAGLAGAGFAVVMAASVLIEGGRPDTFASDRQITAFIGDHDHQMRGSGPRLAMTELPEAGRRRATAHRTPRSGAPLTSAQRS